MPGWLSLGIAACTSTKTALLVGLPRAELVSATQKVRGASCLLLLKPLRVLNFMLDLRVTWMLGRTEEADL